MDGWIKLLAAVAVAIGSVTTLLVRIGRGITYAEAALKKHVSSQTELSELRLRKQIEESVNIVHSHVKETEKWIRESQRSLDANRDRILEKLDQLEKQVDSLRRVGTPWTDEKTIVKGKQ